MARGIIYPRPHCTWLKVWLILQGLADESISHIMWIDADVSIGPATASLLGAVGMCARTHARGVYVEGTLVVPMPQPRAFNFSLAD